MSGTPGDVPTACQACAHGKFEHGIEGRERCSTCGCRGFFRPGATGCDNPSCANCYHTPGGHVPAPPASVVSATPACVGAPGPSNCDGCGRGLPVNAHGNHQGPEPWDIQHCTADRYAPPTPAAPLLAASPPTGGAFLEGSPWDIATGLGTPLLAAQRGPESDNRTCEFCVCITNARLRACCDAGRSDDLVAPAAAQRGPEPVAGARAWAHENTPMCRQGGLLPAEHSRDCDDLTAAIERERATHAAETARLRGALEAVQAECSRKLGEPQPRTLNRAIARVAALAAEGLAPPTKETE